MKDVEIALLGGSFNPPHVGHLLLALFVKATEPVDEVWLLPAYRHPFGKPLADFEHRRRMCELMCKDASGWLKTSDVERHVGGEGRTVDTLEWLTHTFAQHRFAWIIGSDILKDLAHWKDFSRVEQMARIIVVQRAGHPSARAVGPPMPEVSSTAIREQLQRGEDASHLVPRCVLAYARENRLYGPSA